MSEQQLTEPAARGAARRTPGGAPALELRGVSRSYGAQPVLSGAELVVPAGAVAWLGGPNGAGKTTLLRVAAGLILPDAGEVRLFGLDPERDRHAYQRRLGVLSAGDRGLYARLTVVQNLEFSAGLALIRGGRVAASIERALTRFDLGELAGRRVDRLSTGQRQRVRLATALLHDPDVLLLDEPHASLDDRGLALLEAALDELAGREGAALWCSPTMDTARLRADLRWRIDGGAVVPA
jgi:ABC-2 type transport system ATP-binding protein